MGAVRELCLSRSARTLASCGNGRLAAWRQCTVPGAGAEVTLLLFRIKPPTDSRRVKTSMSGPSRGNSGCSPNVVQSGDARLLVDVSNISPDDDEVGSAADHVTERDVPERPTPRLREPASDSVLDVPRCCCDCCC